MSYKSLAALQLSLNTLAEKGTSYFWTFTFASVIDLAEARKRWALMSSALVRNLHWSAIRVFELHESHGMHVHAVAVGRYNLRLVRYLSRLYGFGRVHVKRMTSGGIGYIAKYVCKTYRASYPCLKGMRLWAWAGTDKADSTKTSNIQNISCLASITRSLIWCGYSPFMALRQAKRVEHSLIAGDLLRPADHSPAMWYLSRVSNVSDAVYGVGRWAAGQGPSGALQAPLGALPCYNM